MDAYLQRFERYAEAQMWDHNHWGAHLSVLLKGKALDVFSRLLVDKALDFGELRKALLFWFEMTEEGFRKTFRSARPEGSETFMQFATRLENYIERWVELCKTTKSYVSLKDLMLRDQFIHGCGQELSLFLKQRSPASFEEMAKLADQYVEARGTNACQVIPKGQKSGSSKPHHGSSSSNDATSKTSTKDKKCYNCDKLGHITYDCRAKKNVSGNKVASLVEEGNCKRKVSGAKKWSKKDWILATTKSSSKDLTTLSISCDVRSSQSMGMPVVKGCVGTHCGSVLRDTVCSGVVVRRCLVDRESVTDRVQVCTFAYGSKLEAPIAVVEVDSPYFVGITEAWALETQLYDLIIV